MDRLFELKGQMQQIYANYSTYIDKAARFFLSLATFYTINSNIGFMELLANPVVTLVLSVAGAFLPVSVTVLLAAGLVLAHMYAASVGMMAVTAAVFLIMFIFYIRFSPRTALVVLLIPVTYMLKIPYVVPIACGLLAGPTYLIPVVCGTLSYFLIYHVKLSAASLKGDAAANLLTQVMTFIQKVLQSKEMWLAVGAFVICLLLVYSVRRMSVDHAWKIAAAAGGIVNVVVMAAGDMLLSIPVPYAELIIGNVVALLAGMILEFVFFSVDYTRGEKLQFEDDEYYYYVKAVPKIGVAASEKTVKRINERRETEIIDAEEIRKKSQQRSGAANRNRPVSKSAPVNSNAAHLRPGEKTMYVASARPAERSRIPQAKSGKMSQNTDHFLLTQSLRKELNLDSK